MTATLTPPQVQQPVYEITADDRKRQETIRLAWQAYDGDLPAPLQKMPDGTDPNVLTNRCQAIVERGVDFLFGKELEISVEEDAPDEAQELIDDTWGRKETRIPLLQDLAMNGAMSGRAFLRIVPGQDGSFRLVVVDPSIVFVQTAPQDCETVLLYCIEYSCSEKQNSKSVQVFYREEITRIVPESDNNQPYPAVGVNVTWQIQHWSRVGDRGNWAPAGEPISWSYPFAPLFSCKNLPRPNDFWGKPDITPDIIGVNKALNLEQSCIQLVQILYGQPILYSTGTGMQTVDVKPGRIIGLPPDGKIMAVSYASDVANGLAFASNLRSDIDEQAGVPAVATGRITDLPRGNIAGVAIELMFMPLLLKTEKKRCGYGELIIDVSKAILVLAGMSPDINVGLTWVNPLPHDDLPAIQAAVAKQSLGYSQTTLIRETGGDPEEEDALLKGESQDKLTKFSRGQGMPPADPAQQPAPVEPAQPGQEQQGGQQ